MILCIYIYICVFRLHSKGEYPFTKIFVPVKGMKECNIFFFLERQSLLIWSVKPLTGRISSSLLFVTSLIFCFVLFEAVFASLMQTHVFIEYHCNACLTHFNHFLLQSSMHSVLDKAFNFCILVSDWFCCLSGAMFIPQVLSIRGLTFFELCLDKKLNKSFLP